MKKRLGLYVHIPFCRSKCLYCDFCSFPRPAGEPVNAYLAALERDLIQKSDLCGEYEVDTVYFGGGTPTSLPGERLPRLLDAVTRQNIVVFIDYLTMVMQKVILNYTRVNTD